MMKFKIFTHVILFIFLTNNLWSQITVTSDTDLQNKVNAANPGDVFIVSNGTYEDFYASFTVHGTEENPIIIKAETVGGVTLTLDSHFVFKKASHIVLEGFIFDCTGNNTLVKLEASNNIRITRNEFELTTERSMKWIVITGYYNDYTFQFLSHHNRIDHNIFKNKTTAGNFITIDGTYNEDKTNNQQSQYDRIDHNYFYKTSPRLENEKEAVRIGNSQLSTSNGFTTVEFNLFEECDGDPEIVSVKSNDNIIRHNTFKGNYGTLTLRQGNRNLVEGNYFFGDDKENGIFIDDEDKEQTIYTGGLRVHGTDHVIINNYFEGLKGTIFDAPITLTQGDAITGLDTDQSLHYRAERITIAYNTLVNNTYGIELGYAKGNGSYDKELKDIVFVNNVVTGSENNLVKFHEDQVENVEWKNNIMHTTGSANLVNDGYTFTVNEIKQQNPNLTLDGSIWIATENTPLLEKGLLDLNIEEDIEGQLRPLISNPGADHYSLSEKKYRSITINDVGPNAYENTMSLDRDISLVSRAIIYPNPTRDLVEISIINPQKIIELTLYNVIGELVKKEFINNKEVMLDLNNLTKGVYFLKIRNGNKHETHKIIKE